VWQSCGRRSAGALSVLVVSLGAGCSEPIMTPGDHQQHSQGNAQGSAAFGANGLCLVGRPTREGVECQTFRTDDDRLYTLIGDFGSLAGDDDVCVCGQPVEMSTCMQGTTIRITRIGPPNTCPY
jgi:hypothetical protein